MADIYVTNEQIQALSEEAAEAGDDAQVVMCAIALELEANERLGADGYEERFGGGGLCVSPRDRDRLSRMTAAEAWDECALIIGRRKAHEIGP